MRHPDALSGLLSRWLYRDDVAGRPVACLRLYHLSLPRKEEGVDRRRKIDAQDVAKLAATQLPIVPIGRVLFSAPYRPAQRPDEVNHIQGCSTLSTVDRISSAWPARHRKNRVRN